jgi:hypothetical protein
MSEDKKKYYLPEDVWKIIKYKYLGLVRPSILKFYSPVSIMSLYDINISRIDCILSRINAKNHPYLVEPRVKGNYESWEILTKEQRIQLIWKHLSSNKCNKMDRGSVYEEIYYALYWEMA